MRVVGTFHQRQQREFGGHAAFFQFFDDVVQIAAAALEDAAQAVGTVEVPGLAIRHQRVVQVGHAEATANAFPQVLWRCGEIEAASLFVDNDLDGQGCARWWHEGGLQHA